MNVKIEEIVQKFEVLLPVNMKERLDLTETKIS